MWTSLPSSTKSAALENQIKIVTQFVYLFFMFVERLRQRTNGFFCEKCYPKWIVNGAENLNGDFSAHVVIFTDAKRNVNDSTSMKSAASILTVFDPIFLSSQSDSIKLLLCAIFFLFVLMKSNSRKSWKFVLGFTSRKKI